MSMDSGLTTTSSGRSVCVYDVSSYVLGTKGPITAEEKAEPASAAVPGDTKQTVCAVLLAHLHRHPVVFMLRDTATNEFQLPGGEVPPGEDDVVVLCRKLEEKLSPSEADAGQMRRPVWKDLINEDDLLGTFWRPHADGAIYPYLPVHVTNANERIRGYLVRLPEQCLLACFRDTKLESVPFYDLYQHSADFGAGACELPALLSRYDMTFF